MPGRYSGNFCSLSLSRPPYGQAFNPKRHRSGRHWDAAAIYRWFQHVSTTRIWGERMMIQLAISGLKITNIWRNITISKYIGGNMFCLLEESHFWNFESQRWDMFVGKKTQPLQWCIQIHHLVSLVSWGALYVDPHDLLSHHWELYNTVCIIPVNFLSPFKSEGSPVEMFAMINWWNSLVNPLMFSDYLRLLPLGFLCSNLEVGS